MRESESIRLTGEPETGQDRTAGSPGEPVGVPSGSGALLRRLRALRKELVPYARAQGVLTDEDVFRVVS